jgi:hypothetical protein
MPKVRTLVVNYKFDPFMSIPDDQFTAKLFAALKGKSETVQLIRRRGLKDTFLIVVEPEQAAGLLTKHWAICHVSFRGEGEVDLLKCTDIACKAGVLKGVKFNVKEQYLCCHLRSLRGHLFNSNAMTKIPTDFDSDDEGQDPTGFVAVNHMCSDDEDSDDDEANVDPIDYLESFVFDQTSQQIHPSTRCSTTPLPIRPSKECQLQQTRRMHGEYIRRDNMNQFVPKGKFWDGKPCYPKRGNCQNCSVALDEESSPFCTTNQTILECGTTFGMIEREIMCITCSHCRHVKCWNPDDEYIHTIYNGRMGGTRI